MGRAPVLIDMPDVIETERLVVRSPRPAMNEASFTLEGRLRNHGRETTGELRDTMVYALVSGDPAVQALLAT
jgi:hypothetical protein